MLTEKTAVITLYTQPRKTLKNITYYKELSVKEADETKQATEEEAEEG